MRLHHVQLPCPSAGEEAARRFHVQGLGITEVDKPEPLRDRGGCWFRGYDAEGRVAVPPYVRCHTRDTHGNRVELLADD